MTTFVALLRGINLGGHHTVSMAELRAVVEDVGAVDVATYIQSGNVVFRHQSRAETTLADDLERRIVAMTGFAVPVVLRTVTAWDRVVASNPFPDAGGTQLGVTFFKDRVMQSAIPKLDPAGFAPEEFVVAGREIYMHLPNGFGRATLGKLLKRVTDAGTARNWNTVLKLQELANQLR